MDALHLIMKRGLHKLLGMRRKSLERSPSSRVPLRWVGFLEPLESDVRLKAP